MRINKSYRPEAPVTKRCIGYLTQFKESGEFFVTLASQANADTVRRQFYTFLRQIKEEFPDGRLGEGAPSVHQDECVLHFYAKR